MGQDRTVKSTAWKPMGRVQFWQTCGIPATRLSRPPPPTHTPSLSDVGCRGAGEVMLQRRAAVKDSWPHRWDISSAGHVSAGETAAPTAQREVEEELGLTLPAERFEFLYTHLEKLASVQRGRPFINNEFNDIFLVAASPEERRTWVAPARDPSVSVLKLQEIEVCDVKWVPWAAVVDLYHRSNVDGTVTPSAATTAALAAWGLEVDDSIVPASDFASAGRVFDVIRHRCASASGTDGGR